MEHQAGSQVLPWWGHTMVTSDTETVGQCQHLGPRKAGQRGPGYSAQWGRGDHNSTAVDDLEPRARFLS